MESRSFIKAAEGMIEKIEKHALSIDTPEARDSRRDQLQKELNRLFSGLQNPSLPTASRLREAAMQNGFSIDPSINQQIAKFDNLAA